MACCPLHPEVETRLQCAKHGTFVCPRCLACRDPEPYCRHRSGCLIRFMQRERRKEEDGESRP